MSKERELLAYALDRLKYINFEDDHLTNDLIQTIQKHLNQPARKPLSDGEITDLWANKSPANEFECVRLVEKAHGIGGGE